VSEPETLTGRERGMPGSTQGGPLPQRLLPGLEAIREGRGCPEARIWTSSRLSLSLSLCLPLPLPSFKKKIMAKNYFTALDHTKSPLLYLSHVSRKWRLAREIYAVLCSSRKGFRFRLCCQNN